MPLRSGFVSPRNPRAKAALAASSRVLGYGSQVNATLVKAWSITTGGNPALVIRAISSLVIFFASAGLDATNDGLDMGAQELLDQVRARLEELRADDDEGGHELALRPQAALIDKHLAAALLDQARPPRFGHPRPVDAALFGKGSGMSALAVGMIRTVPPSVSVFSPF